MEAYPALGRQLDRLKHGTPYERLGAIEALVADRDNRAPILKALIGIIRENSEIVYRDTPRGLAPGEPEKYRAMNDAATREQAAIMATLGILGPDGLLDDPGYIDLIDRSGMLRRLENWPDHVVEMQLRAAEAARLFLARHGTPAISGVTIYGLGGSAAPHDIAREIIYNLRKSSTEIEVVHADTPNPDLVDDKKLVMLCSFSGNTEETLHCYETIKPKTRLLVALARGGKLRELAAKEGIPFIQIPEEESHRAFVVQPRESVCLQMTSSLAFLAAVGLLAPGSEGRLDPNEFGFESEIPCLLLGWRQRFGPQVAFAENPAKQLAFFLLYGREFRRAEHSRAINVGERRVPFVLADRDLAAVAHETRTQIHERSKLNAGYYEAPEFLHNLVESIRAESEAANAGLVSDKYVYYFVRSVDEEPRIRLRLDTTIRLILEGRGCYAVLNAEGRSAYERALFITYFNAHMTTYLAVLNGLDPLPVPTMSWIKNVMDGFPRGGPEEKGVRFEQRPALVLRGPNFC